MLQCLKRIFLSQKIKFRKTNKRGIVMRKGTKKIRKVCTRGNEYYIYDLDENMFGKRPRLYAKTEEELIKKIKEAEKEKNSLLLKQMPKGYELHEYVKFYFKNIIGKIPAVTIRQLMNLFKNAVFGSSIDHDIREITAEEITDFYELLADKYPFESVKDIDDVLRKTFVISNNAGVTELDYSVIPAPENKVNVKGSSEYIAEKSELEKILNY